MLSALPEANCDPSGLKVTEYTEPLWPVRVFVTWPEARSQTFKFKKWRSVWLHHRMKRKAQLIFTITELSWVSQEYPAPALEANFVPSGLKATQRTAALCPLKSFRTWPEARFQTCRNEKDLIMRTLNKLIMSLYGSKLPSRSYRCSLRPIVNHQD